MMATAKARRQKAHGQANPADRVTFGIDRHHLDHSQVVKQADRRIHAADQQQHEQEGPARLTVGVVDRGKNGKLADESSQGRQAHQAEHRHRHQHDDYRRTADQPRIVGDFFAPQPIAQKSDDGEDAQVHEQIDKDIKCQGGDGSTGGGRIDGRQGQSCRHRHHHVAGVGDGRIGHQAFDVRLAVCGQIAERACDGGQRADEQYEIAAHRLQMGHLVGVRLSRWPVQVG